MLLDTVAKLIDRFSRNPAQPMRLKLLFQSSEQDETPQRAVRFRFTNPRCPNNDEPFFTNGKCGDTYHRGFVSTSDAAHGKVFVGGSLFCPSGSPCSPTTDIFLPGPATNVSFDLQSGFQTLVQTDGFSRLFPSPFSPATQFQWLHVVIPSTGSHITLTTNGFPSTHVIDNFTFTLAPPPPPPPPSKFIFDLDDHYPGQKLLLHRYDEHDLSGPFNNGYFSNYQVTTVPLDQAPQFRFPGAVTVNGVATAQSVYVRVIDPPDTAAYVPHPTADDNIDPHRKKGTLFYYDSSGNRVSATPGGMLTMTANSDNVPGRANIFLSMSRSMRCSVAEHFSVPVLTREKPPSPFRTPSHSRTLSQVRSSN